MAIAPNPEDLQVPGVVEMNPTSLPELLKPSRDTGTPEKPKIIETTISTKL